MVNAHRAAIALGNAAETRLSPGMRSCRCGVILRCCGSAMAAINTVESCIDV